MARKVKKSDAETPIFTVHADLEFEDKETGERWTDNYEIKYNGLSAKRMRELLDDGDEGEVTEENRNAVAEQLAQLINHIPDITNDEGTAPAVLDVAFYDGLTLKNLKAVNDAVRFDINPPKAQPAS